ncbi:MAG: methylamine utilization protein MauE [Pseudomonadales bacterium]|nr:methylamine utilization protein MauE [Pseudomonadales bacterium]
MVGIFAMALKHKIGAWPRFCASLAAYKLVPDSLTKPAAGVLIILELATIVGLLFVQPLGFLIAALLFASYLIAIGVNLARGRAFIDCGCGDEPTGLSQWLVMRNSVLVVIAAVGASMQANLTLGLLAIGLCLSVVAYLLYSALDQMISNFSLHRRLYAEEA